MKGIVAFDSVYGNTKRVAEAIAEQLKTDGQEVNLVDLGVTRGKGVKGDFLFIGSPTRMGKPTRRAKGFVKRLGDEWRGKPAVAFDTIMKLPGDPEKRQKALKYVVHGAAPQLQELAQARGLNISGQLLRIDVLGLKGPLSPTALDEAKKYAHEFITKLNP